MNGKLQLHSEAVRCQLQASIMLLHTLRYRGFLNDRQYTSPPAMSLSWTSCIAGGNKSTGAEIVCLIVAEFVSHMKFCILLRQCFVLITDYKLSSWFGDTDHLANCRSFVIKKVDASKMKHDIKYFVL